MSVNPLLSLLVILLSFGFYACQERKNSDKYDGDISIRNHDLSYTPYQIKLDSPDFIICDSTEIKSGRNKIQYVGGLSQLKTDLSDAYQLKQNFSSFNGFIVIRFIVNCQNKLGRYRVEALNLNFSSTNAPSGMVNHVLDIFKKSNHWIKRSDVKQEEEFSKFINIKFKNGQIEHVLR